MKILFQFAGKALPIHECHTAGTSFPGLPHAKYIKSFKAHNTDVVLLGVHICNVEQFANLTTAIATELIFK